MANENVVDNKKTSEEFRKNLIAFMQQKGFVWGPSPEIYGGISGFYTYAPLGKLLKNNVENSIRKIFQKQDFWEVECPTVLPKIVWEASGHLGGFTDPVIKCSKCKSTFRADKLIEEKYFELGEEGKTAPIENDKMLTVMSELGIKCPSCKSEFEQEIKSHNLMMKTTIGLDTEAYNRPETATTTYLPFPRYVEFFRSKLPFGVFQIGKAYRNEISPRQHLLRCREFTQAEGQFFIFEADKKEYPAFDKVKDKVLPFWTYTAQNEETGVEHITLEAAYEKGYLKNRAYASCVALAYNLFESFGIPVENMRLRQHDLDERAFYADDAWDLEVKLNAFGWTECCGVHDRTTYDLDQHAKFSKKELIARTPENKKEVPHVIEIAFGTDRPVFALLDIFFEKKDKDQGKTIFKIPYHMAPVKVAVFPLMKKAGMPELAREIYEDLSEKYIAVYDQAGPIGKRYLRVSEQGVPYSVTIDFDAVEKGICTIRDRDTEKQAKIKVDEIEITLDKLFRNKIKFDDLDVIEN